MAQSEKKPASRASGGGKRTAPSGSNHTKKNSGTKTAAKKSTTAKTSSGGSRTQKSAPAQQNRRPIRREVWALVCAALAVFSVLGCFGVEAIFIDFFGGLMKGLLGYGFWVVPLALVLATYILAFHRGRPVRLRLFCALMLPVFISAVIHSLLAESMDWGLYLFGYLWNTGKAMHSGGALAGMLAQSCVTLFSNLGAFLIFAMVIIVLSLAAFNRSLMDVAEWIFNRPRYEYEEKPERPRRVREELEEPVYESIPESVDSTARRRVVYDIPVEDGPLMGSTPAVSAVPEPKKKKESFFNRIARVPSPDQVLSEQKKPAVEEKKPVVVEEPVQPAPVVQPAAVQPEPPKPAPEVVEPKPVAPPVPLDVTEPAAPVAPAPVQPAPKSDKVSKQDAQMAAMQVAEDIQRGLDAQDEEIPAQYPPAVPADGRRGRSGRRRHGRAQCQPPASGRYHPLLRHRRQHRQCDPRPLRHPL